MFPRERGYNAHWPSCILEVLDGEERCQTQIYSLGSFMVRVWFWSQGLKKEIKLSCRPLTQTWREDHTETKG